MDRVPDVFKVRIISRSKGPGGVDRMSACETCYRIEFESACKPRHTNNSDRIRSKFRHAERKGGHLSRSHAVWTVKTGRLARFEVVFCFMFYFVVLFTTR